MLSSVSISFVVAAVLALVVTEILRSVVHARRKRADGLGGTQDIAMWGTLICAAFLIAALLFAVAAW